MPRHRTHIDVQVAAAVARREDVRDLLCQSLIEIDTLTARIDVLLARRFDGQAVDVIDQMT